jgi:Na+(H+)/acetate symporter ActP
MDQRNKQWAISKLEELLAEEDIRIKKAAIQGTFEEVVYYLIWARAFAQYVSVVKGLFACNQKVQ